MPKAREDVLVMLNRMWSPCCFMRGGNFKAFGNTPCVDLLKDLDMGKKLDILLAQQGDLRHIMKTIAAMNHYKDGIEQKPIPDQVTFRFVDVEPANIARNALIFELLESTDDQIEDVEFIWNVWFNSCLPGKHLDRLQGVIGNLLEDNSDFAFNRKWKFADEKTKTQVTETLEKWMSIKENGVFREGFANQFLFKFESYSKFNPNVSRRYATKWPYKKFEGFERDLNKWNEYGVLDVGAIKTGNAEMANPTMFRKDDILFNVEPKLCPYALFCPLKSDDIGTNSTLTDACFMEFVKTVRDMKQMLIHLKVQINFEIGDSLEFFSSHKERKYNLIHTSDLADTKGLTNVLLACEPLLKQKNSVLVTTTEEYVYVSRKDYIQNQTACSAVNLPTFFGVQIAENLSLGQNFIGKDSPVQVYRWVKRSEMDPSKISLRDSPNLLQLLKELLNVTASKGWSSSMTLATIIKRFQERTSDNPEFTWEQVNGLFHDNFQKSLLFVCKILGIVPSTSLRIAKVTIDATRIGLGLDNDTAEDSKGHRLVLIQPYLFSCFIPDACTTDLFYYNHETKTITLLLEEEEYHKMLRYTIHCTCNQLDHPFLSEVVKFKNSIVLEGIKTEPKKSDQVLIKENIESYDVILTYKGKLNEQPVLTFEKRPCKISITVIDSNGKTKIPLIFTCHLTNEIHNIHVEKATHQIHITLYKEYLQRLGHHLLPSSRINLDLVSKDFALEKGSCGVVDEIQARWQLLPRVPMSSLTSFITTRLVIKHMLLKTKWITERENALNIFDVSIQQMFLKIHEVYIIEGYPVADVTVFISEDADKRSQFLKMAAQDGWIFGKEALWSKISNTFDNLKNLLQNNSKRVPQDSSTSIPGCYRSFLDIRFSDFDDREIPKSKEDVMQATFQGSALRADFPGEYGRCCHCLKFGTDLLLCDHCAEAMYCDQICVAADFVRHVVLGPSEENEHHKCQSCDQTSSRAKACSKCKEVYYCDRQCQEKDWPNHKKTCNKSSQQTTDPKLKRNLLGAFTTKPAIQDSPVDHKTQTDTSIRYAMGDFNDQSRTNNAKEHAGSQGKSRLDTTTSSSGTKDKAKITPNPHDIDTKVIGTGRKNTKNDNAPKRNDVDQVECLDTFDEANEKADVPYSNVSTPNQQCANCRGPSSNLISCTVCSTVRYCGYQCQLTHWPLHHKQCVKHLLLKLGEQF